MARDGTTEPSSARVLSFSWQSTRPHEWAVKIGIASAVIFEVYDCEAAAHQRREDVRRSVASTPSTLSRRIAMEIDHGNP